MKDVYFHCGDCGIAFKRRYKDDTAVYEDERIHCVVVLPVIGATRCSTVECPRCTKGKIRIKTRDIPAEETT
jgi:hypothetical protein